VTGCADGASVSVLGKPVLKVSPIDTAVGLAVYVLEAIGVLMVAPPAFATLVEAPSVGSAPMANFLTSVIVKAIFSAALMVGRMTKSSLSTNVPEGLLILKPSSV
jgi:hypothetical protein